MKILFVGDIVSFRGCEFIQKNLSTIKNDYSIDFVIANGENSENGNGISPRSAELLLKSGVNVITNGNHTFKRRDIDYYLDNTENVIRPYNLVNCNIGKGYTTISYGTKTITVINLLGNVFMSSVKNPFKMVDSLLRNITSDIIIVDFHAEATSEKRAMGFFLDGRVTAVLGTHTHTQTNDAQILPKGTAYITDVGMTGPINSVLGIDKDIIVNKFLNNTKTTFVYGKDNIKMNGCILNIDTSTKITSISVLNYI